MLWESRLLYLEYLTGLVILQLVFKAKNPSRSWLCGASTSDLLLLPERFLKVTSSAIMMSSTSSSTRMCGVKTNKAGPRVCFNHAHVIAPKHSPRLQLINKERWPLISVVVYISFAHSPRLLQTALLNTQYGNRVSLVYSIWKLCCLVH